MINIVKRIAIFKEKITKAKTKEEIERVCKNEYRYLKSKGYAPSTIRDFFTKYRKEILPLYKQGGRKHTLLNGTNDKGLIDSGIMIRGLRIPLGVQVNINNKSQKAAKERKNEILKSGTSSLIEIKNLERYVKTAMLLIKSEKWQNVAVGLMALTGRRPTEIVKTAIFTDTGNKYELHFDGQLKKKGKCTDYDITTIAPSEYIIRGLKRLRQLTRAKNWQNLDNDKVNSNTSKALASTVSKYLLQCVGIDHLEVKDLRKIYAEITYQREILTNGVDNKILWYGKQLGHFNLATNEFSDNSEKSSWNYVKFQINEQGKDYIKANLVG